MSGTMTNWAGWDKEMQDALKADGEKLRQLTGEEHGPYFVTEHEEMTQEGVCPRCADTELHREEADVGVGIIYGPRGCPSCGWSEDESYDLRFGGGVQDDGSYLDPYGGITPAANPIAIMLAAEQNAE